MSSSRIFYSVEIMSGKEADTVAGGPFSQSEIHQVIAEKNNVEDIL